jgi:transposase
VTTHTHVIQTIIGADVAKAEIVICHHDLNQLQTIPNQPRALAQWLKTVPITACIAVEATNTYHLTLVELAHKRGHRVYLIDGYRLNHYRKGLGGRAKTDASDARLLARYLAHEHAQLRPWTPPPPAYRLLQRLLRRRASLVKTRVALTQSFGDDAAMRRLIKPLLLKLNQLVRQLEQQLMQIATQADAHHDIRRCRAIEGIGPLTATALVMASLRGTFTNSDAFVAFLGLDVRVKESGTYSGRRKLTKQGDPEIRRLLHTAAMAASRQAAWKPFYQRHLARGLKPTQALVALARKLARVAFAIIAQKTEYQTRTLKEACSAT